MSSSSAEDESEPDSDDAFHGRRRDDDEEETTTTTTTVKNDKNEEQERFVSKNEQTGNEREGLKERQRRDLDGEGSVYEEDDDDDDDTNSRDDTNDSNDDINTTTPTTTTTNRRNSNNNNNNNNNRNNNNQTRSRSRSRTNKRNNSNNNNRYATGQQGSNNKNNKYYAQQDQQRYQQPIFFAESRHEFAEVSRDVHENRESVRRMKMKALERAREEAQENLRNSRVANRGLMNSVTTSSSYHSQQQQQQQQQQNLNSSLSFEQKTQRQIAAQKYGEMLLNGARSSYLEKLTIEDDFRCDGDKDDDADDSGDDADYFATHQDEEDLVKNDNGDGSMPMIARDSNNVNISSWRMKDRMKTTSVALVLCLNIGVDPPDCLKVSPCALAQCWINPLATPPQRALDSIGKALQAQYERWQPRAKYRLQLDPTVEDVKKLCLSCRRSAKQERVLFHYNGHGVPRPTQNGEIWVFNKNYTQYIPLSLYDVQQWTGAPAIYLFDCSSAGTIVKSFLWINEERKRRQIEDDNNPSSKSNNRSLSGDNLASVNENNDGTMEDMINNNTNSIETEGRVRSAKPSGAFSASNFPPLSRRTTTPAIKEERIVLAACSEDETLPQSVELPADLFTACLTTPIKIALQWFVSRSVLKGESGVSEDIIDKIPGLQNNRKTPLGELNWIFTAITDTIAWNVLPRPLFQQLFRQDLLLASLFRNFLLAERIMRANDCTPVSIPELPPTHQHPMWLAWDMAVENCLLQIPALIEAEKKMAASQGGENNSGANGQDLSQTTYPNFIPSSFFSEQLTAFEVWLERGDDSKDPPEQLPIVLQVLLSQSHRLRALVLLGRFLDMGSWAVDLALSVGIFPYVLKLLQTTAPDLRQILVFIWTKILAFDRSCQVDLVKDSGHAYFIRFLDAPNIPAEERAMAAFILASVCDNHPKGQQACLKGGLVDVLLAHISRACDPRGSREATSPLLAKWLCLCLAKLCEDNVEARRVAFRSGAVKALSNMFTHQNPEARSAAAYALGAMIDVPEEREARDKRRKEIEELKMASSQFNLGQHASQNPGSNDNIRPASRGSRPQSRSVSRGVEMNDFQSDAELLGRKLSGVIGEGSDEGRQHNTRSVSVNTHSHLDQTIDFPDNARNHEIDEEQQRLHEERERNLELRRQQYSDERDVATAILAKLGSDSCTSSRCEMAIAIGRFARGHGEVFQATAQKWRKHRESKLQERQLNRGGSTGAHSSGGNIVGLVNKEFVSDSARSTVSVKPSKQRRYSEYDSNNKFSIPIDTKGGSRQDRQRSLSNLGGFAERYSFSSGGSHDGSKHFSHMRRVAESDSDDVDDLANTSYSEVEQSEDDDDGFDNNDAALGRDEADEDHELPDNDEVDSDGKLFDSQKGSSGDTLTDEQPDSANNNRRYFSKRSNAPSSLTKNLGDYRDEERTSYSILVALADLAVDPSPRVASCGQAALLSSKLHSKHPISLAATRAETFGARPGRQANIQRELMKRREDSHRRANELLYGDKLYGNTTKLIDRNGRKIEVKTLKRVDSWSSRLLQMGGRLLGTYPHGSHGSLDIHNNDNVSESGDDVSARSKSPDANMSQRTSSDRVGERSLGRLSVTSRSSISLNTTGHAFSGVDLPANSPPALNVLNRTSAMMQSPPQSPLRRVASSLFNTFKTSGSNPDIARSVGGDVSETLARNVNSRVARVSLNDEELNSRARRSSAKSNMGGRSDSSDNFLARQDSNDSANENKQFNTATRDATPYDIHNDDLFNVAKDEASLQGKPVKPPISRLFESSREHFSKSLLEPEEETTDFEDDDRDSEDSDSDQGTFSDNDQDSYDDYSDAGSSAEEDYVYAYGSSFARAKRVATANSFNVKNNEQEFLNGDDLSNKGGRFHIEDYSYESVTLSQRQHRQDMILDPLRRRKRRQSAVERIYRGKERAKQNLFDFTNVIATHENVQNSRHNAPTAVVMHPLLPNIASSSGRGTIRVYDYASKTIINAFDAQLSTRSATQLALVNQLDDAMLLCAGSDGTVKLWRDYFRRGEETLVAAWRTLKSRPRAYKTYGTFSVEDSAEWGNHHSSHHPKNSKTNAVVLWQQAAGCLYAAGNTLPNPILNVWDASRELCLESLVTPSAASSLAAEGALLMVGANDGSVLSYDLRTPARLLSVIQTHEDPVISILLQPGGVGNLVATGSYNGDVHFCDLRNAAIPFSMVNVSGIPVARKDYEGTAVDGNEIESSNASDTKPNRPSPLGGGQLLQQPQPVKKRLLTTLISTPVAPYIIGGTSRDAIKVWDVEGNEIGDVLYTNKTTKARIGHVTAMAFHPNQMAFVAGELRGTTTIFGLSEDCL